MAEKRHKHAEVIERFRFKDQIDEIAKSNGQTENKQDLEAPSQVEQLKWSQCWAMFKPFHIEFDKIQYFNFS